MTHENQLKILASMVDEVEYDEDTLSAYLDLAGDVIRNRLYPYMDADDEDTPVPAKYHMLQVDIASVLFAKRGAEGQTTHDENGVKRVYASAGVPEEMLSQIAPFVGVIR